MKTFANRLKSALLDLCQAMGYTNYQCEPTYINIHAKYGTIRVHYTDGDIITLDNPDSAIVIAIKKIVRKMNANEDTL